MSNFYVADEIGARFAAWCKDEGLTTRTVLEELLTALTAQPVPAHRDKAGAPRGDTRKPWELPAFFGGKATEKWTRDAALFERLRMVRTLLNDVDENTPFGVALASERGRLEQVLKLSSVRFRGE